MDIAKNSRDMIVQAYGEYRTETYKGTEEDGKPIICNAKMQFQEAKISASVHYAKNAFTETGIQGRENAAQTSMDPVIMVTWLASQGGK